VFPRRHRAVPAIYHPSSSIFICQVHHRLTPPFVGTGLWSSPRRSGRLATRARKSTRDLARGRGFARTCVLFFNAAALFFKPRLTFFSNVGTRGHGWLEFPCHSQKTTAISMVPTPTARLSGNRIPAFVSDERVDMTAGRLFEIGRAHV
jgi:hypothetical protein